MSVPDGRTLGGVFFDMDGTLLDSEPLTDVIIRNLTVEHGLPLPDFPLSQFHGVTWQRISETLVERYPTLAGQPLAERLQSEFHRLLTTEMPPLIHGVQRAFANASEFCIAGVVSSSQRASISAVVANAGLAERSSIVIGAEDVQHSKPDPECYLLAAERASIEPRRCLVFEDSRVGIEAAHAAGMYTVGVVGNRDVKTAAAALEDADLVIRNYEKLPPGFFRNFVCRR